MGRKKHTHTHLENKIVEPPLKLGLVLWVKTHTDLTFLVPSVFHKPATDKESCVEGNKGERGRREFGRSERGVWTIKGKKRWRCLAGSDMGQNKHSENRTFSCGQKWAGLFQKALREHASSSASPIFHYKTTSWSITEGGNRIILVLIITEASLVLRIL